MTVTAVRKSEVTTSEHLTVLPVCVVEVPLGGQPEPLERDWY